MDIYEIARIVILIEFVMTVILILLTYVSIFIIYLLKNRARHLKKNLEKFLRNLVVKDEIFQSKKFLLAWKRLDVLLSSLNEMDKEFGVYNWKKIKNNLLHEIILPLARKSALSSNWTERLFSAKAFSFIYEKGDEILIEALANDENDLVAINAERAIVNHPSEESIKNLVERLSAKRVLSQRMFLSVFDKSPLIICRYVEHLLESSLDDPYVRMTCYRILLKYPPGFIRKLNIYPDLQSNIMDLRLKVLKFISHAFSLEEAMPILIKNLNDDEWEVRVVALHGLRKLHASKSAHQIEKLLRDPNWWVRLIAAETLNSFGERGRQILKNQEIQIDQFAYDISQHVLSSIQ